MRKQYFFDIELETGEKRTRDSVGAANKYIFTHSTRPINYSNKSTSHVLDKQTNEYGARQLIPYLHSEWNPCSPEFFMIPCLLQVHSHSLSLIHWVLQSASVQLINSLLLLLLLYCPDWTFCFWIARLQCCVVVGFAATNKYITAAPTPAP